jgi:hypothetical protein
MTVTVALATQTVTWSPTTALTTTASPATPSSLASALDSATITYSVTNAGATGCAVNSSTAVLTFTTAGSCIVRASAQATSNYAAATRDVTFVISLASRTLTINAGSFTSTYTMITTPPTLTSTASAGSGTKSYASSTDAVCTINSESGLVAFVSAGTCTITATITADATYASATSTSISFTTTRATLTPTFVTPGLEPDTYVVIDVLAAVFLQTNPIAARVNTPSRVTFLVNNRAISGCTAIRTVAGSETNTATCRYRPTSLGSLTISVTITPNSSNYSPISRSIKVAVRPK